MIRPPDNSQYARRTSFQIADKRKWFVRLLPELWRRRSSLDHDSALSRLDWTIEMLHSVRENRPSDLEHWWSSLKDEVLGRSRLRDGSSAQTRRSSSTKL